MPGFNGTGPMGQGPRTGRGMGRCGGSYGYGRNWLRRSWFGPQRFISPKNELANLEEEEKILEEELSSLREEIKNIKNRDKDK